MRTRDSIIIFIARSLFIFSAPVLSEEKEYGGIAIDSDDVTIGAKEYSPHLDLGYPQRVLWENTHLHTSPIWYMP